MLKLTNEQKEQLKRGRAALLDSPEYRRKDPAAVAQLESIQTLLFGPADEKSGDAGKTKEESSDPSKSALRSKLKRLRESPEYLNGDKKTVAEVTALYEQLNPEPSKARNFYREEFVKQLGLKEYNPIIAKRHLEKLMASESYLDKTNSLHASALADVETLHKVLYGEDKVLDVPQLESNSVGTTTLMSKAYDQPDAGDGE